MKMTQPRKETDLISAVKQLITESNSRDKNEANTRHKIIDFVLHEFLNWPKNRVSHEEYVHAGYADFILRRIQL